MPLELNEGFRNRVRGGKSFKLTYLDSIDSMCLERDVACVEQVFFLGSRRREKCRK
jgi:hypothetical protein